MKRVRVLVGLSTVAVVGVVALVALIASPSAGQGIFAEISRAEDGSRVSAAIPPEVYLDPTLRGVCLVFDRDRARAEMGVADTRPLVFRAGLEIESRTETAHYELTLGKGQTRLCLPFPGLTMEPAVRIDIRWDGQDPPRLDGVEALRVSPGDPIPADPGAILSYRRAIWRDPRFEVFRWAAVPSILVFDTSSYDVQDRLFKRLAFFVEKTGYAGTIPDYGAIADLHGFNAHDYRAEDLARFYRAAEDGGVVLLPEEMELRDILIRADVIRDTSTGYLAGVGGVLSLSRSSTAAQRARFMTHEGVHGLYFASERFRGAVTRIWDRGSEDLKRFFQLYLAWPDWGYDLSNRYLLINEFMAYLLQYTQEETRTQLFDSGVRWLAERYPDQAGWIETFRRSGEAQLLGAHRALEAELWREIGATAGSLAGISPAGNR